MRLTLLTAADLAAALPMLETIEAMKQAFADFSSGRAQVPQRFALEGEAGGVCLVKPAGQPGMGLGAKLVSVFPENTKIGKPLIHGVVILVDPSTGEPLALLEGAFLTAWRTGAASGAATDLLALPDAQTGAVLGAGVQARTQVLAIDAVRDLETIRIHSRTRGPLEKLVDELQPRTRATLVPATSSKEALEQAEIVCTATTSPEPVVMGRDVRPGCHINAVGSFGANTREVDSELVANARIFVDSREAARIEAGDLLIPSSRGLTESRSWTELGEVVEQKAAGRLNRTEVTFFKSVGLAVQDIAAGFLALERARELDLGQVVEL